MLVTPFVSRKVRMIAAVLCSFPLTFILYGILVLGFNTEGLIRVLLSPLYWLIAVLAVYAGVSMLWHLWYAWHLYVFVNILINYFIAIMLLVGSVSSSRTGVFIISTLLQLLALSVVTREFRVPYFLPRIRWWETDLRRKLSIHVRILRDTQEHPLWIEGEILDISPKGCFIKTHVNFLPQETLQLEFSLFEKSIECQGEVITRASSAVTHPKGIGVRFLELDREANQHLKSASKQLKQLSKHYAQLNREKNWQDYLEREHRYQGTSKHESTRLLVAKAYKDNPSQNE